MNSAKRLIKKKDIEGSEEKNMGLKNLKELVKKIDESELYKEWGGKTPTEYFRGLRIGLEQKTKKSAG